VGRWRALIDELVSVWPGAPLLWYGLSMGTAYGLPLLASEQRIGRAVLGMWGTSFVQSARLVADARSVRCPVLFQQKWDDELFTREGQLALFDALGTRDKRLHAYPGGHVPVAGEQMRDVVAFLAQA
jgi:alpha-beta hydrolase superfamily lysophospholipase